MLSAEHQSPGDADGAQCIQPISVLHHLRLQCFRCYSRGKTVRRDGMFNRGDMLLWVRRRSEKNGGPLSGETRSLRALRRPLGDEDAIVEPCRREDNRQIRPLAFSQRASVFNHAPYVTFIVSGIVSRPLAADESCETQFPARQILCLRFHSAKLVLERFTT